jgi:hypothetical protein
MRDAIEMAREANLLFPGVDKVDGSIGQLKRFEALVRADEREEGQRWFDAVTAQHKQEILAEREACTKVAEDSDHVVGGRGYHDQLGDADATARNIAAAIRNRGNK